MIASGSLLLLAVLASSPPAQTTVLTGDETNERMTLFYTHASEAEFELIQRSIRADLDQWAIDEGGVSTLAAVFLARVNERYGWALSDVGNLDDAAKSILAHDSSPLSRYVHNDAQVDPGKIDVWWISFFATGDTQYLDRILARVADVHAVSGVNAKLLAEAARWSVRLNARDHPAVLRHAKAVASRHPPVPNREELQKIISKAEEPDG